MKIEGVFPQGDDEKGSQALACDPFAFFRLVSLP